MSTGPVGPECQGVVSYQLTNGIWVEGPGGGCVGTCAPPLRCKASNPLEILGSEPLRKAYAKIVPAIEKAGEGDKVDVNCICQ